MSAPETRQSPVALHKALQADWSNLPGRFGFLSAVNHSTLGKRFIIAAFVFFAIGGVLAMLIRAQLSTSNAAFIGPEIYNQVFTMHGTVMMFLFAIPMFEGLAIYLLPKMLGSRDLAFPRLGAYGFWCYIFGGSILIVALLAGVAPDSGWFMYTPLSSRTYAPGINSDVWLLGITFVEISALSAAVEIMVTILKMRAPGMSLDRMPIFAWYMLVTAGMMLVGFPPLILGSILLETERAFDWPFFDPLRGGDSLLWQHLFWLFGHPEVYIIFLPAAGAVSTILPVLARRKLVGYTAIVVSIIALGFVSFGLWVHHMFTVGIPHLALGFFSAASMLVVIPTGVQIFAWLGTLIAGRPQMKLPMLFLIGFFVVFVMGGLTGVMVAVVPFDWQAHDTYFVVAHLHYVLVGGFVFPMLAAAYYWLPNFTGRQTMYGIGYWVFWLIFIGFNVTFFLMHLTGLLGMPRRVYTYSGELGWDWLNLISSFGGFVLTAGFALFAVDVAMQSRFGVRTRRNPWKSGTLEWATPMPAPVYAFASLPLVDSRDPLHTAPDLPRRLAAGEGYLGFARKGRMETLMIDMVTGRPQAVIVLPGPTYKPLICALVTGLFFLGLLFKVYPVAILGLVLAAALLLWWAPDTGPRTDEGAIPVGRGESLPTHYEAPDSPSRWAMIFTLTADGAIFGSLLFGAAFLLVVAPGWPPPVVIEGALPASLLAIAAFAVSALSARRATRVTLGGASAIAPLGVAFAGHAAATAAILWIAFVHLPDPTSHAYAAISGAILFYLGLHAVLGAIFAGFGIWRVSAGFVSPARSLDIRIGRLMHDYIAGAGLLGLAVLNLLPWMAAP